MAAHIDRYWVNKEIRDFNKGIGKYIRRHDAKNDTLNRIAELAEAIAAHLSVKGRENEIQKHLELSYNDELNTVETNAREIVDLIYPQDPSTKPSDVVDSLLSEEIGDEDDDDDGNDAVSEFDISISFDGEEEYGVDVALAPGASSGQYLELKTALTDSVRNAILTTCAKPEFEKLVYDVTGRR